MLNKMHFKTTINASSERVWNILWEDATYRIWTAAFSEGSHAISDWKEGSKVLFLDGNGGGMFSKIYKLHPNTFMGFEHLGIIKNNEEQPQDEFSKSWAGAKEDYILKESNGFTELEVQVDTDKAFENYFKSTFPKALDIVKQLSEQ